MKKITFGIPEKAVPSIFCDGFCYKESAISFDASKLSFRTNARGCVVEFPMEAGTHIFGFGLQLKQFDHTGRRMVTRVNADPVVANGESHAPVPFFVTNKGYGMYFDTARYTEFDCGRIRNGASAIEENRIMTSTDELYKVRGNSGESVMTVQIPAAKGIDLYIIEGKTITDIVAQYNMLSGGGCDVPEWGLGVFYRCCTRYNDEKVKETADYFREKDMPCSIIGLEPGWQTHSYSCSYVWDGERFPDPAATVGYLKERGFHVNLWEHAFTHSTSPIYDKIKPYSGSYEVWGGVVPDFATAEAKEIFAGYHRDNIVALGVDGFKLDECDSSDNTGSWSFPLCAEFPSGLDGEQYHSLFGTLYCKTMLSALGDEKTLSEVRCMGALASSYPFALYSDLYSHRDFVRGVVNSGFSGILWAPELRHADSIKDLLRRLQSVVFSAQCLINAWYCDEVPWKAFDCENEVRELLKLRERLVPKLKKAFELYRDTGKPPIRALVMDFTDDPETYKLEDEYMFCDDLLVAPVIGCESDEREVYIPDGEWENFFTGEKVAPGRFTVSTEGIPVYKKIG